jgi:hypothetical protein
VLIEADIRRSCLVSLVVCDDFNSVILPDTNTRICGSEVYSDCLSCNFGVT